MKKILIFFAVFLYADITYIINTIKEIETFRPYFKEIKTKNVFVNIAPKIYLKNKKAVNVVNKFQVNAVFQNKVNINGIWYKIGQKVNGFKILKIYQDKIILRNAKKTKIIKFTPKILKAEK